MAYALEMNSKYQCGKHLSRGDFSRGDFSRGDFSRGDVFGKSIN